MLGLPESLPWANHTGVAVPLKAVGAMNNTEEARKPYLLVAGMPFAE